MRQDISKSGPFGEDEEEGGPEEAVSSVSSDDSDDDDDDDPDESSDKEEKDPKLSSLSSSCMIPCLVCCNKVVSISTRTRRRRNDVV